MSHCGRCEGTGFVNLYQVPVADVSAAEASPNLLAAMLKWIAEHDEHDVSVCSCCGNGDSEWHDEPGHHNESTYGKNGPYAYNGGLPECY